MLLSYFLQPGCAAQVALCAATCRANSISLAMMNCREAGAGVRRSNPAPSREAVLLAHPVNKLAAQISTQAASGQITKFGIGLAPLLNQFD